MNENLAYTEDPRYEYYNGIPACMSPRPATNHTIASGNIFNIFKNHLKGKQCRAFPDGVDVHLDEEKKDWVIPDVMIVCNKDIIKHDGIYGVPSLVVEVLSPSTAKNDKGVKKRLYEQYGVNEYWIVDTASRSIEVYILQEGRYELDNVYSIYPDYVLKKMSEEERSKIITMFSPKDFPKMSVSLDEVFDGLI